MWQKIVAECSDTFERRKPPWRARKERYLAHLPEASPSALGVSVADKLDNARAILFDYRRLGDDLWARFDPEADQLWYYRSLVTTYRGIDGFESTLVDELDPHCRGDRNAGGCRPSELGASWKRSGVNEQNRQDRRTT